MISGALLLIAILLQPTFGLSLLCAFAVFNQKVAGRKNLPTSTPLGRELRIERFILQVWQPLTGILLMTTALILTHSRGGFFSTLAGGWCCCIYSIGASDPTAPKRGLHSGGAVLVAVIAFVLTSEVLIQRIDHLTIDGNARIKVYGLTAEAIEDNPVLGFGYGTFSDSFRLYRDDTLEAHYDKTHNTYLEIFSSWAGRQQEFCTCVWPG